MAVQAEIQKFSYVQDIYLCQVFITRTIRPTLTLSKTIYLDFLGGGEGGQMTGYLSQSHAKLHPDWLNEGDGGGDYRAISWKGIFLDTFALFTVLLDIIAIIHRNVCCCTMIASNLVHRYSKWRHHWQRIIALSMNSKANPSRSCNLYMLPGVRHSVVTRSDSEQLTITDTMRYF